MKLEIGCGPRKIDSSFIGVDKYNFPGVDIVVDLEEASLPLPTNSVDEINALHVFEHINNYLPLIEELWRVLKPGAKMTVKVPHYKHECAYTDPTHVHFFTSKSFNFFDKSKVLFKETGWFLSIARFHILDRQETEREIIYCLEAKKNKVLFIAPPDSIHTARWKNSLLHYGYQVDVASRSLKGIANIALGDSNELDRLNRFKNIPENLRKETTLSNYDVVHAHFATCYGHSLLAVPDFIKKVLSVWGEDVLDEALHGPDMKKRLIDSLEAADHITVTSEHMRAVLTDKYSVQRQKIWVIPWGHRKIFKREEQSLNIFEKFGLSPGVPIITSGRVCRKQNNIESIVDAFMEADINAQLLVMTGKISDQLYLSQLKAKTSQNPKIIYIDNVNEEDLLQIYNISEAIISIPDVDQLSTTIIESLACGTPVICSDIEVYHERIVHGKNGCFINSRNKEQLQKALRYFSEGNAKKAMRNFAMQSVKGDSWEDNVKKLMSVYDAPK